MLHDMSKVGNRVKPKADATLRAMKKERLIEYIRDLEYNYNVAVEFNEQQAKNFQNIEDTICEMLREDAITMSTAAIPHKYFKAISSNRAVEIVRKGAVYEIERRSHGK